jgi:hypothetical protein
VGKRHVAGTGFCKLCALNAHTFGVNCAFLLWFVGEKENEKEIDGKRRIVNFSCLKHYFWVYLKFTHIYLWVPNI